MANNHMLIDARNALYRAIYAVKSDRRPGPKYHNITILLRQFHSWMMMYQPTSISIFWDAPRKEVWRRTLHEGYKDRTSSGYVENISEDLRDSTNVAKELFAHMNVRQFERPSMEADDLIYAAISGLHPIPCTISSSDSDMVQIPFSYNSCKLYDPGKKKRIDTPTINPVWQKALVGDKSDCIPGYKGIGPKKSVNLLENHGLLNDFLSANGSSLFYKNLLLIDLALCPKLLHNQAYTLKRLSGRVEYDDKIINSLIMKYKINGLLQEYNDLIIPFKFLT